MDIHDEIQKNLIQLVRNDIFNNKFETIIINGFIQNDFGYFNLESDVEEGDFIHLNEMDEPLIIEKLNILPEENCKVAKLITKSEYLEKQQVIEQHFHGPIENFALGDINNYQTKIYLNALIQAIEESEEIPNSDKEKLIKKIKEVANNPYVAGLGTTAIIEGIKILTTMKPF